MTYLLISLKIVASFFLIILIPGILIVKNKKIKKYIDTLDLYQEIIFSFIFGIFIWLLISTLAYGIGISTEFLINFIKFCVLIAILTHLKKLPRLHLHRNYFNFIDIYSILILASAFFVGYIAQYQTGDSDAFAHIAAIRNIANSERILSCDWILGQKYSMVSAYGCNPWYLVVGMIVRFSDVDIALAYPVLSGMLFAFSVIACHALIKELSFPNEYLAKVGSIFFVLASVINWLIIIGENPYYSLDPINNLIFPQHLVSWILFPATMIFFIRYLKDKKASNFFILLICLLVVSRVHPSWLFWAPILLIGGLFFNQIGIQNEYKAWIDYVKKSTAISLVGLIALSGYLFCKNTHSTDINIIDPIALWRVSGGNLMFISNFIYLYDPKVYLFDRGVIDLGVILLLGFLSKLSGDKFCEIYCSTNKAIFNILLWLYVGIIASVFFIVFNPLATFLVINHLKSSVVLYRAFSLITPFLSCVAIFAVLSFVRLGVNERSFRVLTIGAILFTGLILLSWKIGYFKALLQNKGGYYSTTHSINALPFSYLRMLAPGVIVINPQLATPVAALTELDPMITEVWRAKSTWEIAVNKSDNDDLLALSKSRSELLEIIARRDVRYFYLSRENFVGLKNIRSYPELFHLKFVIDGAELWELNERL